MQIKNYFLGFLVAIVLGACSSEEGEGGGSVILNPDTPTSQTIYADETQKSGGIKFTATEPWTATVDEVKTKAGGSSVDWLKLSAYSGGAGEFTLNLTLTPNTTGKSRKAEIRITAGETVLTITVEQKAEKENGEPVTKVKPIKKFTYKGVFNSDKVYTSDYILDVRETFSYDEQGRLSRIVTSLADRPEKENNTITFDYTNAGKIIIKEKEQFDNTTYEDTYIAKLNEQGNVIALQDDDKGTGTFSDYILFSYTDDNRLAKWEEADAGNEGSSGTFSYTNGVVSKYKYIDGKYPEDNRTVNVDVNKAYAHRYPNNLSMDIVGTLLADDDDYDFLFYAGRTGRTSDYLPELIPSFIAADEWGRPMKEGYPTPNTTLQEFYYSIEWSDQDLVMNYTFDKDNCLTGIQTERGFTLMKTTYTVVVSDELVNPEIPEIGYKFKTKDHKTVKEKDDTDVLTWTIEY